jgi:hypothetical protein
MTWLTVTDISVTDNLLFVQFVVDTIPSFFPFSWLITSCLTRHELLVEQELLTLPELTSVFKLGPCSQSLIFCVVFCELFLFVCSFFLLLSLYWLTFDLRLRITLLVSLNISYLYFNCYKSRLPQTKWWHIETANYTFI